MKAIRNGQRRFRLSVMVVVLALVTVSSCSVNKSDETAGEVQVSEEYGAVRDYRPPLEVFLSGDISRLKRVQIAEQAREDKLGECLADQGFDYTPKPIPTTLENQLPDDLPIHSKEWVSKYGFGISTTFFQVKWLEVTSAETRNLALVSILALRSQI